MSGRQHFSHRLLAQSETQQERFVMTSTSFFVFGFQAFFSLCRTECFMQAALCRSFWESKSAFGQN
jgi:hypothetical protein